MNTNTTAWLSHWLPAPASRRAFLRATVAATIALGAARRVAHAMQGGGTISVQGFLCPDEDADASDCEATDAIFNGDIMIAGPDGLVLTLNDGESHAVSHVWSGLPYGTYSLQDLGSAPDGYALNRIDGASDDGGFVKVVTLDDDHPTAMIDLIYIPW
ncbi:MAG: hypothetical protein U0031_07210 [Thermomicrobiales bacterium]